MRLGQGSQRMVCINFHKNPKLFWAPFEFIKSERGPKEDERVGGHFYERVDESLLSLVAIFVSKMWPIESKISIDRFYMSSSMLDFRHSRMGQTGLYWGSSQNWCESIIFLRPTTAKINRKQLEDVKDRKVVQNVSQGSTRAEGWISQWKVQGRM